MISVVARTAFAALLSGLLFLASATVRGDEIDQARNKVTRLDQRVHIMALEFNDAPAEPADLADRRVVDAQGLLALGHTDQAMTLLLEVVIRWPQTPAARDATFLLGDALFDLGDLLSARRRYETAIATFAGTKREQQATIRLIEIALRTGEFTEVDRYLGLLASVPGLALDPGVAYVKAKVLYYRNDLEQAARIFAAIPSTSGYFWRARYFVGTILVKEGDFDGATGVYQALLRAAMPDDDAREVQDLARLALGRICYQQGDVARATLYYQSVPAESRVLADAVFELGWTYVRAKDDAHALAAFAHVLRVQPEGPQAPEVALLVANLHLRQGSLALARRQFAAARDVLEPTYRQLQAMIERSQSEPAFLQMLTARNLSEIDLGTFVPASARKWVRADPAVDRLLALVGDVVEAQQGLADVTDTVKRIEDVLADADRVTLFPDLTRARQNSIDVLAALVDVRRQFVVKARGLEQAWLLEAEARQLDRIGAERSAIEKRLGARLAGDVRLAPDARRNLRAGDQDAAAAGDHPAPNPPRASSATADPGGQLRAAVLRLAGLSVTPGSGTAAERPVDPSGFLGPGEQQALKRLWQITAQETQIEQQVLPRAEPGRRAEIDRTLEIVWRVDAAVSQLLDLDVRVSAEADVRVAVLEGQVADRRLDVEQSAEQMTLVARQARTLGGGLVQLMYTRVANRLYDFIVRADVGLIDVAWAEKDQRSVAVRALVVNKNQELDVARSERSAGEEALARRFKGATDWAKRAIGERSPEGH